MPPASRNHRTPTTGDTPALTAASSLERPAAIAAQNRRRSSRRATEGRPGDRNAPRPDRSEHRPRAFTATSFVEVLRRPLESAQYASTPYREVLKRHGIEQSMSRRGNCLDNAPMESFFASLKKEHVHQARFRTRAEARAAVFEYVEVFYNRQRLHSALGYRTPAEARAGMEGITMRAAA
jgi:putative transposase